MRIIVGVVRFYINGVLKIILKVIKVFVGFRIGFI